MTYEGVCYVTCDGVCYMTCDEGVCCVTCEGVSGVHPSVPVPVGGDKRSLH